MGLFQTVADKAITFAKLATSAVATSAQFLANTASKLVSVSALWDAAKFVDLGNCTGVVAVDLAAGVNFKGILTGDTTFNFTNAKDGQQCVIRFAQDSTGGHAVAFTVAGGSPTAFPLTATVPDWNDGIGAANYFTGQIFDISGTKYIYYSGARITA